MKFFKYWSQERVRISIDQRSAEIKLLVGSNISKEAAAAEAALKARQIEQRIAARQPRDEYDAAIREHVVEVIDDHNIISVCRYGAKVLNTSAYTVLDLDDYPVGFFDFFKPVRKLSRKARIVFKFEEALARYPELGGDFRIYETQKGIRVIGKTYLDPRDDKNAALLRKLHVDWLYLQLSRKQDCYRARLTPKPYRMCIKTIKIKSPLDCETEAYRDWDSMYQSHAAGYSVVRLVKTIGSDFAHDRVIRLHDQLCNAQSLRKLA